MKTAMSKKLKQLARCSAIGVSSLLLVACASDGLGTSYTTCGSIEYNYVSHSDTELTIQKAGENNEALLALKCPEPEKIGKKKR